MTSETPSLEQTRSVDQWRKSFAEFWRGGRLDEEALPTLGRFIEFCGMSADEMIDDVLRTSEGSTQLVLRTSARRKYVDLIEEFEQREGSRQRANYVRSFFIHNGVAMNPNILH